jgi:hypothetical protein
MLSNRVSDAFDAFHIQLAGDEIHSFYLPPFCPINPIMLSLEAVRLTLSSVKPSYHLVTLLDSMAFS